MKSVKKKRGQLALAPKHLALEGPPLKPHQAYALKEAFSESDLPMRVDAVLAKDLPRGWDICA